ncbi:MAG TPA: P1 family peptidase, partial [Rhodanobacter sp.]|nr:P1 family peptidase [Rhodanobacter sp.]
QVRRHVDPAGATASVSRDALRNTQEVANDDMSPLFEAVIESTEEAIYNSLFMATTVTGNGHTVQAIPLDRVRDILARYKVSSR